MTWWAIDVRTAPEQCDGAERVSAKVERADAEQHRLQQPGAEQCQPDDEVRVVVEELERDDARQVRLKSQELQVERSEIFETSLTCSTHLSSVKFVGTSKYW